MQWAVYPPDHVEGDQYHKQMVVVVVVAVAATAAVAAMALVVMNPQFLHLLSLALTQRFVVPLRALPMPEKEVKKEQLPSSWIHISKKAMQCLLSASFLQQCYKKVNTLTQLEQSPNDSIGSIDKLSIAKKL